MNIKVEFFHFHKETRFSYSIFSKGREAEISIFQPGAIREPIRKVIMEIP